MKRSLWASLPISRWIATTLGVLVFAVVLIVIWNVGPKVFDLPIMTGYWVWIIGVAVLCGVPCGVFRLYDLRRFRREYRMEHSLCITCGYDLRASKDRCPECGTPFSSALRDNQ